MMCGAPQPKIGCSNKQENDWLKVRLHTGLSGWDEESKLLGTEYAKVEPYNKKIIAQRAK